VREYSIEIVDSLKVGIRNNSDLEINRPALYSCLNARPKDRGLVQFKSVENPFHPSLSINWPFPQLFKGGTYTLLAGESSVQTVNESTWARTNLDTYVINVFGNPTAASIQPGGVWHFADFGDSWMLFNGVTSIYYIKRPVDGVLTHTASLLNGVPSLGPTIQTGCAYRGRLLIGGISTAFGAFFSANWLGNVPSEVDTSMSTDMSNCVMWSSIGGGDILYPFFVALANDGEITSDDFHDETKRPIWFDYIRRNEWGFMPMPWQGRVHCLKPLGRGVVVYGDGGISALVQYSEPTPTFGLGPTMDIPVLGRGAVGGSEGEHIFVDGDYNLWLVSSDFSFKKLGYRDLLKDMDDIVITYNQGRNEYYICDSEYGYVLTSNKGVAQINQMITSAVFSGGKMKGVFLNSGRQSFEVFSHEFDMRVSGDKSVSWVEIAGDIDDPVDIAVDVKEYYSNKFRRSSWKRVNKKGSAYVNVTGSVFRVGVRTNPYTNFRRLNRITVFYKLIDRRFIRGIHASPSQA